MCQSNQQHVAKKDLFNAFQRRKGVEPLQVGHLFGGITCSHDENFSVVNKISLCTDKVKNVGKDSRLLYIFAETISGMTPAFPCFFEESNKVIDATIEVVKKLLAETTSLDNWLCNISRCYRKTHISSNCLLGLSPLGRLCPHPLPIPLPISSYIHFHHNNEVQGHLIFVKPENVLYIS